MVQWLASPTTHAGAASRGGSSSSVRDGLLPPKRPARRGYSVTDAPAFITSLQSTSTSLTSPSSTTTHIPTEASIPENAVLRTSPPHAHRPQQQLAKKPPRRSYSATDKEPEDDAAAAVLAPRPATGCWGLLDLPPELHYTLFDFLDPIDAVCLGLAHPALYAVHRRVNPRVPLSSRYNGPNDLEWVWRGVRHLNQRGSSNNTPAAAAAAPPPDTLDKLRVKGQVYCRKCGISRCELHRHIRGWMGDGYQYCEIRERFGPPAPDGARSYCFMSSPKDRHRCGRHGGFKASPAA